MGLSYIFGDSHRVVTEGRLVSMLEHGGSCQFCVDARFSMYCHRKDSAVQLEVRDLERGGNIVGIRDVSLSKFEPTVSYVISQFADQQF